MGSLAGNSLSATNRFSFWRTRNSPCAEPARINIISPTICRGAVADYYFVRNPHAIVGLQFACSGEHKGLDRFQGQPAEDTGITSVFLGPRIVASFGKVSGELALELPVSIDNTALQVVPDYRIHGSLAIRF